MTKSDHFLRVELFRFKFECCTPESIRFVIRFLDFLIRLSTRCNCRDFSHAPRGIRREQVVGKIKQFANKENENVRTSDEQTQLTRVSSRLQLAAG